MTIFLSFLFAGIGLTSIVVDSEFFAGWKQCFADKIKKRQDLLGDKIAPMDRTLWWWRKLFYFWNCYQCSGFWVGFMLSLLVHPLGDEFPNIWRLLEAVLSGGAISYLAQVGMAFYNYLNVEYGPRK